MSGREADAPLRAILLMVAAVGIWAMHDAAAKWYAATYPIFVILFWRSLFGLIPVYMLTQRYGGVQWLRPRTRALCVLRGTLGFGAFSCFIFSLPLMPLADAIAVGMSAPIFLTAASALVLREPVGWHRWGAVLLGFAAVLFIVRPGGQIPIEGAALLLTSNLFFTASMLLTRVLGRVVSTGTITLYTACVFVLYSGIGVAFLWLAPNWPDADAGVASVAIVPVWDDFIVLMLVGLMAGLAQFCMTAAFRIAPASVIAPFEYTGMIWGAILGVLIWNEYPSRDVVIGVIVIIASGLYIVHRERLRTRRPAS